MPQSGGGLIRYFESSKEAIAIKPEHIVFVAAAIIATEIVIKAIF